MGQEEMNKVPDSIMEEFNINIKIDQVIIITEIITKFIIFKLRGDLHDHIFNSFLFLTQLFIWFYQSVHEQENVPPHDNSQSNSTL